MGCDIHCVLQKKNKKTEKYETILTDVLPFRNYALFTFLSGIRGFEEEYDNIALPGLPEDFKLSDVVDSDTKLKAKYHNGFYMGEHSYGYISLKDFCNAPTPNTNKYRKYEIDQCPNGYTVTFLELDDLDEYIGIRSLQKGLSSFFDVEYEEEYRLVFGYDS